MASDHVYIKYSATPNWGLNGGNLKTVWRLGMKYGESVFDIGYLIFAIVTGGLLMIRKEKSSRYMGVAVFVLGFGDAFHLVPRVLNYFVNADYTTALGLGKLVTSITMTVFYILAYRIWLIVYGEEEKKKLSISLYILALIRIILCLMPQNNWTGNESPVIWGIIRNMPFLAIGMIMIILFYKKRKDNSSLSMIWLYILLSFLFYMPVATAVSYIPMLGMLMLPKTVCYILIVWSFYRYQREK